MDKKDSLLNRFFYRLGLFFTENVDWIAGLVITFIWVILFLVSYKLYESKVFWQMTLGMVSLIMLTLLGLTLLKYFFRWLIINFQIWFNKPYERPPINHGVMTEDEER